MLLVAYLMQIVTLGFCTYFTVIILNEKTSYIYIKFFIKGLLPCLWYNADSRCVVMWCNLICDAGGRISF